MLTSSDLTEYDHNKNLKEILGKATFHGSRRSTALYLPLSQ